MTVQRQPFHLSRFRRTDPALVIPRPPPQARVTMTRTVTPPQVRKPCGFCNRVRRMLQWRE